MNKKSKQPSDARRFARDFQEAKRRAPDRLRQALAAHTPEEVAQKLTAYEPGIPHAWFGRPVEALTKEELLSFWSGGPEPETRYTDVSPPDPASVPLP